MNSLQERCGQSIAESVVRTGTTIQPASFSVRASQMALRRVAVEPAVVRFAACVGTAMVATSAAVRWRRSAVTSQTEPSTAEEPIVFALGLASAIAAALRVNEEKATTPDDTEPSTEDAGVVSMEETLRRDALPVALDIKQEEYEALRSVLKRTEASSEIDDARLDPVRRLLKMQQPADDTPFRSLIKELERKTEADMSFIQAFIDRLSNAGYGRYDCMTDVATFTEPKPSPTVLQSFRPPADNKLDFLMGLLKGEWRAPTTDEISYWDPMSAVSMLLEGSLVHNLSGFRFIKRLGDFSDTPPNPYDPIRELETVAGTEGPQKYDPLKGLFLAGESQNGVDPDRNSARQTSRWKERWRLRLPNGNGQDGDAPRKAKTLRSVLKTEVEKLRADHDGPSAAPAQTNGQGAVEERIQDNLVQIASELTEVGREVRKLYL